MKKYCFLFLIVSIAAKAGAGNLFLPPDTSYNLLGPVVKMKDNEVFIDWMTRWEQHSAGFEVQRMLNVQQYKTIGFVKSAGSTTHVSKYRYTDDITDVFTSEFISYRLKLIDENGSFSYSPAVAIRRSKENAFQEELYSNPGSSSFIIADERLQGDIKISIYDITGKLKFTQIASAANKMIVVDSGLPNGVYSIDIANAQQESLFTKRLTLR